MPLLTGSCAMGFSPIDDMGQLISHPITEMARPEPVISVSGCHCWELYNSVIIHCFLPAARVSVPPVEVGTA